MINGTKLLWLIPIALYGCTLATTSAYNIIWMTIVDSFPSAFVSFAFSFASGLGHISAAVSPIVAENDPPYPMLVFILINVITLISALFLHKREPILNNDHDESE